MRYIKIFENFDSFFKNDMFYIEMVIDSKFGSLLEIGELGKKLVRLFNRNKIEFRIYYADVDSDDFNTDIESLIFLFNKNFDLEKLLRFHNHENIDETMIYRLQIERVFLSDIPKNIESARLPNDDIDLFLNANKYNL